jgi:predicted phosphodiesterase
VKIGLISDLHGNVLALEGVLDRLDVDEIVCLGDLVGIGPDPSGVVRMVMRDGRIRSVQGNHDHNAVYGTAFGPIPDFRRKEHHAWVRSQLSDDQAEYLRGLPASIIGRGIHFTHAHPAQIGPNVPYYDDPDPRILDDYYRDVPGEMLFFGHTHRPLDVTGSRRYFNPGAVGAQNGGMAQFAILDIDDKDVRIDRLEAPYDIEWIRQQLREKGTIHAESIIRNFY